MSIKAAGGVFGRNPTFRNVEVEGNLTVDGTLTIGGSVITGLNYQGAWDASTNTPDLTALTPASGQFWIVSADGNTNLGGITNWTSGDWALYDGSAWQRVEGGNTDLDTGVSGTLKILNGGTGANDAATARTNLGLGSAATTDSTDYATAAQGSTADSALQPTDIGSTVQGYDADTAKYDDATANFTGTLQNGGSNVVVDTDIGSTVQAYDADTAKLDVAQTWTALQSFNAGFDAEKSSASVSTLNRTTDDGDIQVFEKDGTPVGSAGAKVGDLYIGTGNTAIRFADSASAIYPHDITTNSVRADAIDIGHPTYRFKKLYLSDNVVVASGKGIDFSATSGTGTSELLDDYEEGTWTPTSSTTTISMSGTNPSVYTKIGDTVSVIGYFNRNDASTTYDGNVIEIGGLPFSVKDYEYGIGGFDSYHGSTNRKHGMCYPYEDNLIRFRLYNVVSTNMLWGDLSNTRGIKFSFIYKTSS